MHRPKYAKECNLSSPLVFLPIFTCFGYNHIEVKIILGKFSLWIFLNLSQFCQIYKVVFSNSRVTWLISHSIRLSIPRSNLSKYSVFSDRPIMPPSPFWSYIFHQLHFSGVSLLERSFYDINVLYCIKMWW